MKRYLIPTLLLTLTAACGPVEDDPEAFPMIEECPGMAGLNFNFTHSSKSPILNFRANLNHDGRASYIWKVEGTGGRRVRGTSEYSEPLFWQHPDGSWGWNSAVDMGHVYRVDVFVVKGSQPIDFSVWTCNQE